MHKETIPQSNLVKRVTELLNLVHSSLLNKAREALRGSMAHESTFYQFKEMIQKQVGFVSAGWCGDETCEISIKEETGADIRLVPFESQITGGSTTKCIYCGKIAETVPVFARAY